MTARGQTDSISPAMGRFSFLDAHLHPESRSLEDFRRLKLAGCRGVVAVAGAQAGFSSSESVLDFFRRLALLDRPRIERAGLRCYLALGVHPRGIPTHGLEQLLESLPRAWRQYGAVAVGEIGLESGTRKEIAVLRRQLELAARRDMPVLLHTPRNRKREALRKTLELLEESRIAPRRVLLDHLDEGTLALARPSGCWLGLSLHPAKMSPHRVAELVAACGPERLVLSSDMGAGPSYLFALPAAVAAMQEKGMTPAAIRRMVYLNAMAFLEKRS